MSQVDKPIEQQSQAQPGPPPPEFSPFVGPVNDKSYSAPPIQVHPADMHHDIPEPVFTPPPLGQKYEDPFEEDYRKQQQAQQKKEKEKREEPFNPALNDLPQNQKEESAEQLAGMILGGYELLHIHANDWVKISDKRIYKMVSRGELDMNATVPYDYDKRIPVGEFLKEYNEQAEGTFTVSEEFKEEVTPVLTRVLAKRGHGLSDEQTLLFMFGKDMYIKGRMFFQMKSTLNQILRLSKEESEARRQQTVHAPPPPPVAPAGPPPVRETPVPAASS
ncbi:MAG TPA: hypothetical protein VEA58_10575 [Anaerovoracaceae bacterium]|nr:hypothetical protein [Anaerovoracaceae bacterium]